MCLTKCILVFHAYMIYFIRSNKISLKVLVVDYGFLDSMTGASNRHLGLLYTLAYLGHDVKRAALRVGPNKILPEPAKLIFENMKITQHNKRLLNYRKNDLQEYVSLVLDWKPDLVIMTLWFCGPTIDFTVPGYLINIHRSKKLSPKIIIESSDVHWLRDHYENEYFDLKKTMDVDRKKTEEANIYQRADGVFAISYEDKINIQSLSACNHSYFNNTKNNTPVFVWRYIGTPWNLNNNLNSSLFAKPMYLSEKRQDIVFVGAGSVPTNLAAVSWFITQVWLSLLDSLPNLKFYIIGQWNIKGMIKRKMQSDNFLNVLKCSVMRYNNTFCKKYEGIIFTGKVSNLDLEKYLGDCRLFVSPIQFTTGVNTKNVLALETGIPLITTLNGSSGLVYKKNWDFKLNSPFLVGKNAQNFIQLIVSYYNNLSGLEKLARDGREYCSKVLSVAESSRDINAAFASLGLLN